MKSRKTPLKAVRKYCLSCCGDVKNEVKTCGGDKPIMGGLYPSCPFYNHRLGKNRISVKVIRKHCVEICCNGSVLAVRECPSTECALYEYRMGTNPNYAVADRKAKSEIAKKNKLGGKKKVEK